MIKLKTLKDVGGAVSVSTDLDELSEHLQAAEAIIVRLVAGANEPRELYKSEVVSKAQRRLNTAGKGKPVSKADFGLFIGFTFGEALDKVRQCLAALDVYKSPRTIVRYDSDPKAYTVEAPHFIDPTINSKRREEERQKDLKPSGREARLARRARLLKEASSDG